MKVHSPYLTGGLLAFSTLASVLTGCASRPATPAATPAAPNMSSGTASGQDMVDALHVAFGEHHARAVHTKGTMLEGSFTPAPEATELTKSPIFAGGSLPLIARFSLFAGVPTLADTDDGASPAGFGFKIKGVEEFDVEANQHRDFITATSDEFRTFLLALGAAGKGDKAALDQFLGSHPHAREFLATRTYPASYSKATYFGVNSLKFTNRQGKVSYGRYRFVPRAGEQYLSADDRKAQGPNYLQEEIQKRVDTTPVEFDWFVQIAEESDKIEDPSIAWPETRKLIKLGTITLTRQPADPEKEQRGLLLLPGEVHVGVEPADPMLLVRNKAYPISFRQRQ